MKCCECKYLLKGHFGSRMVRLKHALGKLFLCVLVKGREEDTEGLRVQGEGGWLGRRCSPELFRPQRRGSGRLHLTAYC